ncbi:MAG: S8 family serine peptidase, partial [Syntrophothermus sp.]
MKRTFLILFLAVIPAIVYAGSGISPRLKTKLQTAGAGDKILVWVFFNDKAQTDLKKLSSELVSPESINRRSKYLPAGQVTDNSDVPVSSAYIKNLLNEGFTLKQKSKWLNGVSGWADPSLISRISAFPFVRSIDLTAAFPVRIDKETAAEQQAGSLGKDINSFNYGNSAAQLQQINVPAVHDLGYTGKGIKIGVFDAGFNNLKHEVFSRMNIIAKWDFVNKGPNVQDSVGLQGEGSHGTATLSLIGGFREGEIIGPAFEGSYILAKTENTDSETPAEEDNWIAALEWADSIGVDVISTSLGYLVYDQPYSSYTWQDMNGRTAKITLAAAMAAKKGIVIVVSAGNEGLNTTHNTLGAPADADTVISVGAVTQQGTRTTFSSVGPTSDGRIKPDVMAMGQSDRIATKTGYSNGSGTSFSCPLTAGVAALLLQVNPNLTPVQVR